MTMRRSGLDLLLVPPRVEASLWRRLRQEREWRCREALFDRYRMLARSIARRQLGRRPSHGSDLGDFEHFAYAGLLQAIDRYDPWRDIPFGAYARRRIVGSIADGASRMNETDACYRERRRHEVERARSLRDAAGPADPVAALRALVSGLAIGLMLGDTALVVTGDGADPRPDAYQSLAWRERMALLTEAIDRLPEREATVIRQHYGNGISFTQVAQLMGLSKGRVSQIHAAAIGRLRRRLHGL
ncbi:sigma-70 family RNA polymerase sigma factor [Sphingomonas silueang]|uniref:sigma-70 family RNA polymerase sigma factor n=1 Tax=Sphingomonas silueang TaxID=3156617 RepID=UPI0032B5844D